VFKIAITTDDIKNSEMFCLRLIDYKLNLNTSNAMVKMFLLYGILFTNECNSYKENYIKAYTLAEEILDFIIEGKFFIYPEFTYTNYTPFHIACAVISVARETVRLIPWCEVLEYYYKIKLNDFKEAFHFVKL
jgi:hypothetical protein